MSQISLPGAVRPRALVPLAAAFLALGCGGSDGPSGPPGIASVRLSTGAATLGALNDSLRLSATAHDADGDRIDGVTFTWSSLQPAVVALLDQDGLVRAQTTGSGRIVAKAPNGAADTATITVQQATASIVASRATLSLEEADSLRLIATVRDSRQNAIPARTVSWSSRNIAVATVDGTGMVTARGAGTTQIVATEGAISIDIPIEVTTGLRPSIAAVSPDTMVPGGQVTLTGSRFTHGGAPTVTVNGLAATVTASSDGQITAALPASMPCTPTRAVTIQVTSGTRAGVRQHPLRVAAAQSLAPGASLRLTGTEARCREIVGTGRYMVSVFNSGTSPASATDVRLRGEVASPLLASVVDPAPPAPAASAASLVAERAHLAQLERNRAHLRALGHPAARWREARRRRATTAGAALHAVAAPPAVGDVIIVKFHFASCQEFTPVAARVKYVGPRAIVLEDTLAPLAGTMDATHALIGEEFDQVQYPILQQYFGNTLALDTLLNNDGRAYMLFTRQVNDNLPGIQGFVSSCDLYPASAAAASNEAEIFYARTAAANQTAEAWRRGMRSTVIHEMKHVTSFAERYSRNGIGSQFEHSWLEESTARLAEELYSRTYGGGGGWKANTGWSGSVQCELSNCGDGRPLMMYKHFASLYDYYEHSDSLTPIGRVGADDFTFYASGWSLVRWAIDHHAADEGAFVRALVAGPETGIANLQARTGRSFTEIVSDWTMASMLDDLPGLTTSRAELRLPSWNTRDVMAGLNAASASTWPSPFPLAARVVTQGTFTRDVPRLRAGTAAFFDVTVTNGALRQLLELQGAAGGAPAPELGVAIVRVQ